MFGVFPYGKSINLPVYYATSNFCDSDTADTSSWYPMDFDKEPRFILLVDRGGCTFVKKVRNGQRAGASVVLIADDLCLCDHDTCVVGPSDICGDVAPAMRDDGSGGDVTIPSFLLYKEDADPIIEELKADRVVSMSISFKLPAAGSRVRYDFWSIPTDPQSRPFLLNFSDTALLLSEFATFNPHMYIYDGEQAGCRDRRGENICFTLCTNHGRYCSTDPDDDLDNGISGADVTTESLRRMCIWKRYGEDGLGLEWWLYVREFTKNCYGDSSQKFSDESCISDAFSRAGIDQGSISSCMKDSGGRDDDVSNSLLDAAILDEMDNGITLIPSLLVNDGLIRGALSPLNLFQAICASFADDNMPGPCVRCSHCAYQQKCIKTGVCESSSAPPRSTTSSRTALSGGSVSFSVFLGSVVLIVLVFGVAGYSYHQREQRYMRENLRYIMVRPQSFLLCIFMS